MAAAKKKKVVLKKAVTKKTTKKKKGVKKKTGTKKPGTARKSSTSEEPAKERPKPQDRVGKMFDDLVKKEKATGVQVQRASDVITAHHIRRPTGILDLDLGLGGGLHAGGHIEVFGAESAGKTAFCFRVAGEVQRIYGDDSVIVYLATETNPDITFARRNGFCVSYPEQSIESFERILKSKGQPPFSADELDDLRCQIGEVIIIKGATSDESLEILVKAIKKFGDRIQLIIIDSLGALLPKHVEEGEVGDAHYGGSSRMVTNFMNKVTPEFLMQKADGTVLETTILGINQARADMRTASKRETKAAAGAYAWKHGQLASIELKKGKPLAATKDKAGHEVNWTIRKGKVGARDGKKGTYIWKNAPTQKPAYWDECEAQLDDVGIQTLEPLISAGISSGALVLGGSWITWDSLNDEGETERLCKVQGQDAFKAFILKNPHLRMRLYEDTMRCAGLMVEFR